MGFRDDPRWQTAREVLIDGSGTYESQYTVGERIAAAQEMREIEVEHGEP